MGGRVKIRDIEIRLCRSKAETVGEYGMRMGGASGFEFLVITLETDDGVKGHSFGFAGRVVEAVLSRPRSTRPGEALAGVPHL